MCHPPLSGALTPTHEYTLADPPTEPRARELWLQHAVGFILFEDVRRYALERIDPKLGARAAVEKGIDDALCGLVMVLDGVTGQLTSATHEVAIKVVARLMEVGAQNARPLCEVDLFHGDGMCMGFHGWRAGDFGEHPVAEPK